MRKLNWLLALMMAVALTASVRAGESKPVGSGTSEETSESLSEEVKPEKKTPIKRLMEMTLDHNVIPARQIDLGFGGRTKTLQEVLDKFEAYSEDEEVGALLLNLNNFGMAMPNIEALRDGIAKFRESGKKVFCYVHGGGPEEYLLACATDEIAVAPVGSVIIPGIARLFPFYKGNMEMRGLQAQVVTSGKYKYPGYDTRRKPDEYFTEEITHIIDGWFGDYKRMIADGRKLSEEKVSDLIDTGLFRAEEARNVGLVDVLAYYDDYRDRIATKERFKKSKDEMDMSDVMSLQDIMEKINDQMRKQREESEDVGPKIAVLHARGPIIDMTLSPMLSSSIIQRDEFIKVVEQLRKNKSVKAVVMAVDSPGGSGYASEMILRALKALDEEKPLVVCMQTVAGSGGYYIAIPGRLIFAQPTTITGSIGVLATNVSPTGLYNRMDYDWMSVARGKRSMLFFGIDAWDEETVGLIQEYIDAFYEVFMDRVAEGRKLSKDRVRQIAEGRIYTGRQALDLGLVDRLGGLDDAVESAREYANIPKSAELKIVHYPRPSSIGEMLEGFLSMGSPMEVLSAIDSPAPAPNFEQQLYMLAQPRFGGKVLTWMPLADHTSVATPAPGFPTLPGGITPPPTTGLEALIRR